MGVVYTLLVVVIVLLIILIILYYRAGQHKNDDLLIGLKYKLDGLSSEVNRIEAVVKNEIVSNRNESTKTARDAREEMSHSLKSFGELISGSSKTTSELQRDQLYAFSNNLNTLTKSLEEKLQHLTESNGRNINEVRRELI